MDKEEVIAVVEDDELDDIEIKIPEEKPEYLDDTTGVINTAIINNPYVQEKYAEDPEKVYQEAVREIKEEKSEPVSSMTGVISPFGPRSDYGFKAYESDEIAEDLKKAALYGEQEEEKLQPIKEAMSSGFNLTETQETYISNSRTSYIDAAGRPQLKVTKNMNILSDEERALEAETEYDAFKESYSDRSSGIMNFLIGLIVVALVLFGLYMVYVNFFGI